jgi:hypothetical protein
MARKRPQATPTVALGARSESSPILRWLHARRSTNCSFFCFCDRAARRGARHAIGENPVRRHGPPNRYLPNHLRDAPGAAPPHVILNVPIPEFSLRALPAIISESHTQGQKTPTPAARIKEIKGQPDPARRTATRRLSRASAGSAPSRAATHRTT